MLCLQKNERVKSYYEAVIPAMTVDTFKSHFRMSRRSMEVCKLSKLHAVHFVHRMKMHNNSIMFVICIFFTYICLCNVVTNWHM